MLNIMVPKKHFKSHLANINLYEISGKFDRGTFWPLKVSDIMLV